MRWAAPSSWMVVVLAAGKGKRMGSPLPKVLHPISGTPLLGHVLKTAGQLDPEKIFVVVGHGADQVRNSFSGEGLGFIDQTEQLGTGDAVARVAPQLESWEGPLMVLYGDVPLLRTWTLAALMETHIVQENGATILTAEMPDPTGYGRILRDDDGSFLAIREDADLQPEERAIAEINSGIGVFECPKLFQALKELRTDNAQGEYYLTDVIEWFRCKGDRVGTLRLADQYEISGINTPKELELAGRNMAKRLVKDPGDCPYCQSYQDNLILRQTEHAALRLHSNPYNSGQLLVTPRRHVTWYTSLTSEERLEMGDLILLGEKLIQRAYSPQGLNVGFNSGGSEHLGLELVPRWGGDTNFMLLTGHTNLVPEGLQRSKERFLRVLTERE